MSSDLFPSQADGTRQCSAIQDDRNCWSWFFLSGELGRSFLIVRLVVKLGVRQLLLGQILRDTMEAAVLLLLLLLTLWPASDASFYGNSLSLSAPKRNKNGSFTVGRSKHTPVLGILGPV